jgi:hypothetical protein
MRPSALALPLAMLGLVALALALLLGPVAPPSEDTLELMGAARGPMELAAGTPFGLWGTLLLVLLAARIAWSVAKRQAPLPGYLVLAALGVVFASYEWSNLDWLSLPLEAEVADGGVPAWHVVAPALLPLGAALAYNLSLQWAKAAEDYEARGVAPDEAKAALALQPLLLPLLASAAGLALLLAALFHQAWTQDAASKLPVVGGVLLFPALALGLLVALAWVARAQRRGPPEDGIRQRVALALSRRRRDGPRSPAPRRQGS